MSNILQQIAFEQQVREHLAHLKTLPPQKIIEQLVRDNLLLQQQLEKTNARIDKLYEFSNAKSTR